MTTSRKQFLHDRVREAAGTALLLAAPLALPRDAAAKSVAGPDSRQEPATLGVGWRIVTGSEPLEQVAGADLSACLEAELGVTPPLPVEPAAQGAAMPADAKASSRFVFVGTPQTHPAIAREHRARPFRLTDDPESCHITYRGSCLYLVGAGPKGAMNAVFRFLARKSPVVGGLDEVLAPRFTLRIGGHRMNQTPPPDWSEEEQARYYARHAINVVWGEKQGPPLSYEARRKYGLGLMVEVLFPPGGGQRMSDPALAEAVYLEKKENPKRRALDPFHPAGRATYLAALQETLAANPDVRVLYGVFADYNAIPGEQSVRVSDGKPYGRTRAETMQEILRIMREAIGSRNITATAWLWHAFFGNDDGERSFMEWAAREGFGILYNEAGNNDNWLLRRTNFGANSLKTGADGKSAWGPHFISLVSAGGACESVNPVIGLPLPYVAVAKVNALAKAGVRNLCLWWGSAEGWIYDSNLQAVSELIWQPEQDGEALLSRLSARDFGPRLAPTILRFWQDMDAALPTTHSLYRHATIEEQGDPKSDGLRLYDWWQRMGIFTEWVFGGRFYYELTPTKLASVNDLGNRGYWGVSPYAHENYRIVIERLTAAAATLSGDLPRQETIAPPVQRRVRDMYLWTTLYWRLLASQLHFCQALTVFQASLPPSATRPRGGEGEAERKVTEAAALTLANDSALKERLRPILQSEIDNLNALIALAAEFPVNFNIGGAQAEVFHGRWTRAKEIGKLRGKAQAMQAYLGDAPAPIPS